MENHIKGLDQSKTLLFEEIHKDHTISYRYECMAKGIYGLGERFCGVNHKGKKLKNQVKEQFTRQGEHTYLPIPFYMADDGHGVFLETSCQAEFEFRESENIITIAEDAIHTLHFFYGSMKQILHAYMSLHKEPVLPPRWAFGVWASANRWNCQKHIMEQIEYFKKYQYPVSVIVIEAWSDEATFYLWNGATYQQKDGDASFHYDDFQFHEPWEDPKKMIDSLHQMGIKVVLWQIPALKKLEENQVCPQHLSDCEYAVKNDLVVKKPDQTPYLIPKQWFIGAMLPDFYSAALRKWWCNKRRYLLDEMGVDGFKTDGGEFIHDIETVFSDGVDGRTGKNEYPVRYEQTYQELIGTDRVLFSRAGYLKAEQTPIHWAGDQISTFEEMRAVLGAGLSLAMSGVLFWGFDLAGFAGPLPTKELYLRATALASMMPLMQWHSEPVNGQFEDIMKGTTPINDRSPWNMAAYYHDQELLTLGCYFANLHQNMLPHLYSEAIRACKERRPLLCPLMYEYEKDDRTVGCQDEYCIGDLLIAPVLSENTISRKVYLPEGIWYDIWTGKSYQGRETYEFAVPLNRIPVFLRAGGAAALQLDMQKRAGTSLGIHTMPVCILTAGKVNDYTFYESKDSVLTIKQDVIAANNIKFSCLSIEEFVQRNGSD